MLTILDFQITRTATEQFRLEVCERGQSQPLASAAMEYRLDFMAGFELERLDYNRRNPHGRLELLRAYGARLHEKLFASPDVRRVWQAYRERSRFLVLCLRIHNDTAGLEALPWETLHDGEEFIAGGATTEITRLPLGVEPQAAMPALSFPLRLLSFASSPLDLKENERLNVEAEQEILLRAVNDPARQGKLLVDFEDEARREILESSLDGGGYHILHYTGHGVSPRNGGGLLFENAAGEGQRISAEDLLQSLDKAKGSLRLAVISGCNTARTLYTGSFRDLARGMLGGIQGRGVPAVAAMQFSLSDAGGLKFAEAFYPELIAGKPLELVLNTARRALLLTDDRELKPLLRADAFAPVLLAVNGECLRATAAAEAPQMPRTVKPLDPAFYLSTLPQLGFGFYGRRREYRQIRDGFVQRNHRAAIVWGVGGIGKTALASHVADRLYRHHQHRGKVFSGVHAFDCRGGALSVERILLDLHRYLSLQGIAHLEQIVHQSLPPEMAANFVGQLLSQMPLLVIFDNFEDLLERAADRFHIRDENLRTFITTLVKATPSGSRFLFTTRHLFDLGDGCVNDILRLSLNDLSRVEAIYLMQRMEHLGRKSHRTKVEVFDKFGGHPLALTLVNAHLQLKPLADVLDRIGPVDEELRGRLAIDMNYQSLSDRSRELLDRLAAFRQPVPAEAANWVMGEEVTQNDDLSQMLAQLDRGELPDEWKQLDEAALLAKIEKGHLVLKSAPNLEGEIRELIEWGLLTPISENGAMQALAVHSLVREFCHDRQAGVPWRVRLREAAAFYTYLARTPSDVDKDEAAVWCEMEAFELLMEAEDYVAAANLLRRNHVLLDRWGLGRNLESRYRALLNKVSGWEEAMVLHNLAMKLQHRGKYGEALHYYEQALRIMDELGDRANVANSLHQLGVLHEARGKYGEALQCYEQSLRIEEELGNRAGVAGSLHQIGNLHYLHGEYGEALQRYEQALRIAKELGDHAIVARSLYQLGMLHQACGDYGEALQHYEQALRIEEELGDRAGVANSMHQLGMLHQRRGEYQEALERYEQALEIREELGNRAGVAGSLHQIGNLHYLRGEYSEALPYYEQSLRIEKELGNHAGVAGSLYQFGMLHQARGEYSEAIRHYEQALRIAEELGDRAGVAKSLNAIGALHQMCGEYDEALPRYEQSLQIKEELGDRAGVAESHANIGNLLTEAGLCAAAFPLLMNALATYLQLKLPDMGIVVNNLRTLRARWGEEAFAMAWRTTTGEDVPEWLQEASDEAS